VYIYLVVDRSMTHRSPLSAPALGMVYGVERRIRIVVHGEKKPTESDDHGCPITFSRSLAKGVELKAGNGRNLVRKSKEEDRLREG
jgi:hypothetical protein